MQARLRTEQRMGLVLALAAIGAAISVHGQNVVSIGTASADSRLRIVLASSGSTSVPSLVPGRLIRVIEDPNLGDRWMLCRNLDHPGGPGSLLHVAAQSAVKWNRLGGAESTNSLERDPAAIRPVIRAGDRVIVEENSAVAEARLTAVALESATVGSAFNARLEIGGKVVRAVAMRTGQALFQPQLEVRR